MTIPYKPDPDAPAATDMPKPDPMTKDEWLVQIVLCAMGATFTTLYLLKS